MSTFSRVISRPTTMKGQHLDPVAPPITMLPRPISVPLPPPRRALATTRYGHGFWQPDYSSIPPLIYNTSFGGDFYPDTIFNPVWDSTYISDHPWPAWNKLLTLSLLAGTPQNTAQEESSCTPSLMQNKASLEPSPVPSSSPPGLLSPPATSFSTIAVFGSARPDDTFAHNCDRPEANPNFIHKPLGKSKALPRQARMRDSEFRNSDDEEDHSVTVEFMQITAESCVADVMTDDIGCDARPTTTASRLSKRVKVPPPINTSFIRVSMAAAKLREEYEVEVGDVDGSDMSWSSNSVSSSEANSEKVGGQNLSANTEESMVDCIPTKRSYAAIVASSPPRATLESRVLQPHVVQVAQFQEQTSSEAFGWQPFAEPLSDGLIA